MTRRIAAALVAATTVGLTGCASTWDTMTSRRFRDAPFDTMFKSEDPVAVLRDNPVDGDARARAMAKLQEPALSGRPDDQDAVVELLGQAATTDPSPWVRAAAIDALGRFQDDRAPALLVTAYHQASGRAAAEPRPAAPVRQAGARGPLDDRLGLHGPQGFAPDQSANLRGRALEALAKTGRPEAVTFLAGVAAGRDLPEGEDPAVRGFVRQRAVAGLGQVKSKESVVALAKVLAAEHGKDATLVNLAHGGLVELTGQKMPADPEAWNAVVQAEFEAPGDR